MRSEIRAADGRVVATELKTLSAAEFRANRSADVRWTLPLPALAPGDYLLTMTATRAAFTATRSLQFKTR